MFLCKIATFFDQMGTSKDLRNYKNFIYSPNDELVSCLQEC